MFFLAEIVHFCSLKGWVFLRAPAAPIRTNSYENIDILTTFIDFEPRDWQSIDFSTTFNDFEPRDGQEDCIESYEHNDV